MGWEKDGIHRLFADDSLHPRSCGSITHQTKDCLERPRTKGAKWTNKNIAADDKVQDVHLATWDAKRDRWNGFDAKDYNKVVERYEQVGHACVRRGLPCVIAWLAMRDA